LYALQTWDIAEVRAMATMALVVLRTRGNERQRQRASAALQRSWSKVLFFITAAQGES